MNLTSFMEDHKDAICSAVVGAFPPLYDAAARADLAFTHGHLLRRPLGGQLDAIRATALSLTTQRGTVVVGEQGSGKSYIAAAASSLARFERVLVMAPPHLVKKWEREVRQTVPGARTAIVRSLMDVERVVRANPSQRTPHSASRPAGPLYVVLSRERAKLGYR